MTDLIEKQKVHPIQTMLRIIYSIVPIVAGLDKFTNLLVDWTEYISPLATKLLPVSGHSLMMIVGVIEIAAGLAVIFRPKIGSIIVSAWLILISLNLLTTGHYFDVAVRDLVMAAGAFALYRLTLLVEETENVSANKLASVRV